MAILGINIIFLQFVYLLITITKVIFYKLYFIKNYPWLNYKVAPTTEKLKDRNSYIITEIAWTIFSSTDIIVLSTFVSTQISSVYAVYNMIFSNLNVLLNAVYTNVSYVLGQTYYESKQKYMLVHDVFTSIFLGGMTILMCICYVLILPFIQLYTRGVMDINYIYTSLPLMFAIIQILSWSRYVTGYLTGIAGYANKVSKISLLEAMINIILSMFLVKWFGIVGVLFATTISLPFKIVYCIYLSDKKILNRSYKISIRILGMNYLFFMIIAYVNKFITLPIYTYLDFLKYALIVSFICTLIGVGINILANPNCLKIVKMTKKV